MAIRRAKSLPPTLKKVVERFIPLPAVGKRQTSPPLVFVEILSNIPRSFSACASTCNVLFMRFHEIYDGIEVLDEANKPIGISKVAAKKVRLFQILRVRSQCFLTARLWQKWPWHVLFYPCPFFPFHRSLWWLLKSKSTCQFSQMRTSFT